MSKNKKRWVVISIPGREETAWFVYDRVTEDASRCADADDAARFCRECNEGVAEHD